MTFSIIRNDIIPFVILSPFLLPSVSFVSSQSSSGLLGLESSILQEGLDPAMYSRLKGQQQSNKKKKRRRRPGARLSASSSTSKKRHKSSARPPKVEFLIPETYETPPPECSGGDGTLSGMTFVNFLISAIAVGANLISNINSNQRNNNNNNNDNNDNVANFNFVNNNNAGNNQNSIAICPFPCVPGPPPIPTGRRRRRRRAKDTRYNQGLKAAALAADKIMMNTSMQEDSYSHEGVQKNSDGDVYLATMLAIKLYTKLLEDPQMAFCGLYTDLESINGLHRAGRSLLAVAASRMAFHANLRTEAVNCSHNVILQNTDWSQ